MKFTIENIILDSNFKNKRELFEKIASLAKKSGVVASIEETINGFEGREAQGTTGFEDGFAIPHARINSVQEPSVFVIRNNVAFDDWEALDGAGVKYAIALLIPATAGEVHMEVLSTIATKLIDEQFRNSIKSADQNEIFQNFNDFLQNIGRTEIVTNEEVATSNKKFIIGISACPAGIAHTFMTKQKMEDGAKELGIEIKWETQGANGQKNTLTAEDIKRAEVVIIASEIKLDLSRFKGKRLIATDTNDAIKNGSKLIERALEQAEEFDGEIKHKSKFINFFKTYKQGFQSSFGTPWIYMSITASLLAIISLIGFSMYGRDWTTNGLELNENLFKIQEISKFALQLSMPFMAATVAKKMIDRGEVFAITFVTVLLLNSPMIIQSYNSMTGYAAGEAIPIFFDWNNTFSFDDINTGSNIIGAIISTFLTVLSIKAVFELRKKINENKKLSFISNGLSPWLTTAFTSVLMLVVVVFFFGAPLAFASKWILWAFLEYGKDYWWIRFLVGGTLGCLIAFDLGGFINKTALISLIGLAQYDLRFAAIISVGIPLASIGYGTTFALYKNKFRTEDVIDASQSFRKGLNGMTEGPLNPTNKYGWKLKLPNIVATFCATGMAFVLGLYIFKGGHIGILYLGAQGHLAQQNDLHFLSFLLPNNVGWWIMPISITYGIVGYYMTMFTGSMIYVAIASITFNVGKDNKKVFKNREVTNG